MELQPLLDSSCFSKPKGYYILLMLEILAHTCLTIIMPKNWQMIIEEITFFKLIEFSNKCIIQVIRRENNKQQIRRCFGSDKSIWRYPFKKSRTNLKARCKKNSNSSSSQIHNNSKWWSMGLCALKNCPKNNKRIGRTG